MTLSAKLRFQASPHAQTLFNAVAEEWFQRAAEAAIVEMQFGLGKSQDMGLAAANACRMEGARMFLDTFMRLSDPIEARKPDRAGKLNYEA